MTDVKTEWASLEEHEDAMRNAIERRAYGLYELDGFTAGHDQEHWFQAERQLTNQDIQFSIVNDFLTARLSIGSCSAATLLISVSAHSILIFGLRGDAGEHCDGVDRECLRILSLPVEVDAAGVTVEFCDTDLALRLPLAVGDSTLQPFGRFAPNHTLHAGQDEIGWRMESE
jgi:hypothetical protein